MNTTTLRTVTGADLGSQVKAVSYGTTLVPSRMKPVTNDRWHKPKGGLWTSTWTRDERISGWHEWGTPEGMVDARNALWRLDPEPTAQLIQIDSVDDLNALVATYSEGVEYSRFEGLRLDFEAMARDGYAGMNLTEEGQWATRDSEPGLYGWDCESTVWFRWAFVGKERLARGLSRWEQLEAIGA